MSESLKNIKGTQDILFDDNNVWQYLESSIHKFLTKYGFLQIRTPLFENTNLFSRSIGLQTDIVSKEMYSWTDQGGTNLTLKPEVTASVVRAYIQHNLGKKNPINKLYYIDTLFRRERPQKGRYRQFNQFGVEAIGSAHPEQDAEIIALAYNFYKSLNIENLTLKINSIGSTDVRNQYRKVLKKYLTPYKNKLSSLSQKRLDTNPLRILDTKIDFEIEIINKAPHIIDFLNNEDKKHFHKVLSLLDSLSIKYDIDHKLVRGLDYYCRTVFEIQSSNLGSQDALCGGGRYDYLVEELGGSPTPAIGFAAGIERLILALNKKKLSIFKRPDIYIITTEEEHLECSFKISESLRNNNFVVINDTLRRSLKSQMKDANRLNVLYTIIIGEDEIKSNKVTIKNMDKGSQSQVPFDKINSYFLKK
jgi:histidyl-tRNA synthetase